MIRLISTGSTYNAGGGDRNRDAFVKSNWNDMELYSAAVNSPYFFLDTFKREDTSPGTLGVPTLSDGTAWTPLGLNATIPNTNCYILSGSCRTTIGDVLYLPRQLDFTANYMGCEFEFIDGNDTVTGGRQPFMVMSIGNYEDGSWINDIIHCYFTAYGVAMEVGKGTLIPLANYPLDGALTTVPRNKRMKMQLFVENDVCIFKVNNWSVIAKDPLISRYHGPYVYWEIFHNVGVTTSSDECIIHSVWAGQAANISSDFPARAGKLYIPAGPYNGIRFEGERSPLAIASANLTPSADISTGSYTVYWRGRIPYIHELSASQTYGMWNLNTGPGDGGSNGPVMYTKTIGTTTSWILEQWKGALYVQDTYTTPVKLSEGKIVDLFFARTGSVSELYVDGVYFPYNSRILSTPNGNWSSSVSSDYFNIGAYSTGFASSYRGDIHCAALLNTVIPHRDMTNVQNGIVPNRLKWATNNTLTSGVLLPDKCYRIVNCSANYYYSGCVANQEFHLMTSGSTVLAKNLANENIYNVNTVNITADNPVVQLGFMCFLDGTHGKDVSFIDLSSNQYHANCTVINSSSIARQTRDLTSVFSNVGDDNYTINSYSSPNTIFFETSLSTNRTVTLPVAGMVKGDKYTIVRTAVGAGTLAIGSLKTIPANTSGSAEIMYDGTNWKLTNYSTL